MNISLLSVYNFHLIGTLQVAEISRLSVQLLHVIFCENNLTCLFRESEETTKHYLCLIIKWWSDNSKTLQFNDINSKFFFFFN